MFSTVRTKWTKHLFSCNKNVNHIHLVYVYLCTDIKILFDINIYFFQFRLCKNKTKNILLKKKKSMLQVNLGITTL